MKTFKSIVFLLFLGMSITTYAGPGKNLKMGECSAHQKLRSLVLDRLSGLDVHEAEATVKISFMVTSDSEIVVLRTKSDSYLGTLDNLIKDRMNYNHVDIDGLEKDQTYHINVTFRKA